MTRAHPASLALWFLPHASSWNPPFPLWRPHPPFTGSCWPVLGHLSHQFPSGCSPMSAPNLSDALPPRPFDVIHCKSLSTRYRSPLPPSELGSHTLAPPHLCQAISHGPVFQPAATNSMAKSVPHRPLLTGDLFPNASLLFLFPTTDLCSSPMVQPSPEPPPHIRISMLLETEGQTCPMISSPQRTEAPPPPQHVVVRPPPKPPT